MRIESQFNQLSNTPTLINTLYNSSQKLALDLMCCRIGIVQAFYPDDLTVDVLITNKITTALNNDGSQVVKDWGKIRAKVCFCSPYITFPPKNGDEVLLLFADREIESWFITGETSPIAHSRMHDETDCIAIWGLRSIPKMIQILQDTLHLFYGNSDIQLQDDNIISNTSELTVNAETSATVNTTDYNLNASNAITLEAANLNITSNLNLTGDTIQTGAITATSLSAVTGATGTFQTKENKTVTVTNGIITSIT